MPDEGETTKPINLPLDIVHSPKTGEGGAWIERDGKRQPAEKTGDR